MQFFFNKLKINIVQANEVLKAMNCSWDDFENLKMPMNIKYFECGVAYNAATNKWKNHSAKNSIQSVFFVQNLNKFKNDFEQKLKLIMFA